MEQEQWLSRKSKQRAENRKRARSGLKANAIDNSCMRMGAFIKRDHGAYTQFSTVKVRTHGCHVVSTPSLAGPASSRCRIFSRLAVESPAELCLRALTMRPALRSPNTIDDNARVASYSQLSILDLHDHFFNKPRCPSSPASSGHVQRDDGTNSQGREKYESYRHSTIDRRARKHEIWRDRMI